MEQYYICDPSQVQLEDLANAIIIQAADDYRKARRKLYKNPDDFVARKTLKEIEAFLCLIGIRFSPESMACTSSIALRQKTHSSSIRFIATGEIKPLLITTNTLVFEREM